MGAIGCNFELFDWKLKADSNLLRDLLAKRHVFFQLAVAVRDALIGVAEPEANQIFWATALAKKTCAETLGGMKSSDLRVELLQQRVKLRFENVNLSQRFAGSRLEEESGRAISDHELGHVILGHCEESI